MLLGLVDIAKTMLLQLVLTGPPILVFSFATPSAFGDSHCSTPPSGDA